MRIGVVVSVALGVATVSAFGLGALAAHGSVALAIASSALALAVGAALGTQLHHSIARPIRTASNVLDAVRHNDYAHRARIADATGPIAELLSEANDLAGHLAGERARANEASALFEAVVQRVDVALLAFDDAGILRWWNPAAERLFVAKLTEGSTAASLGVGDWLEGAAERPVTVPGQTALAAWELRRGVFHREGHRYQFVLLASLRRVRREEERAAWQRLVRVIGHEVNNTLAPVQSMAATCSGMLRDDGAGAIAAVLRALEVIEHRSSALARFIAEYARLARLPEPKAAPMQIAEPIRRLAALDARCPVNVIGKGDVTIFADGPLLEQALVNLIRNAVDAAVVNEGKVTIDWRVEGDEVVVLIADDGPGIVDPENLFVPLFSTKAGGSGIGLVLSRNILEAHGGDVRLENRAHSPGCIARVTIPIADRELPPSVSRFRP